RLEAEGPGGHRLLEEDVAGGLAVLDLDLDRAGVAVDPQGLDPRAAVEVAPARAGGARDPQRPHRHRLGEGEAEGAGLVLSRGTGDAGEEIVVAEGREVALERRRPARLHRRRREGVELTDAA